jgi:hypothetical protein
MWLDVRDTGERKKIFGFPAHHVWSTEKIKPSPDACSLKDSMLRKTDGWYIELPRYECHHDYVRVNNGRREVWCNDKYVQHISGKGKPGFPLFEKTTMIMGDGTNVVETSLETLELLTDKLDTSLFTIPPGYKQVNNEQDLFNLSDINSMMGVEMRNENEQQAVINKDEKAAGKIRIGVYAPTGNADVQAGVLQQRLISAINEYNIESIPISDVEEAKKYNCDYILNSKFISIIPESKAGGIIKAIRKRDLSAATGYNIRGNISLLTVKDGSEKSQRTVDGKYEGQINEAASQALNEACLQLLKGLR